MISLDNLPFSVVAYTADRWDHVCPLVRLLSPAQLSGIRLIRGSGWEENRLWVDLEGVEQAELVVIQRDFPSYSEGYEKVCEFARSKNKPVVYELDDLLPELPDEHPDFHHYLKNRSAILRAIVEADAVTGSTPALCDYMRQYNPNVWLLPNYLDDQVWQLKSPKTTNHSPVIIGYMGGHSHSYDLESIAPVLLKVLQRYQGRVALRFWGVAPPMLIKDWPNVEWFDLGLVDYREFAKYFLEIKCDIFIAPLRDNLFNRCKSHLKYLEYSSLGAPGVYSRITPYESVIEHKKNGLMASTFDEWEAYLSLLIEDHQVRNQLGLAARETVSARWLLSQHYHQWVNTYKEIISSSKHTKAMDNATQIASKMHHWQKDLEERVSDQDLKIKELNENFSDQTLQIGNLKAQLEERDAEVQHIYGLYHEVMHSTGWKMMQRLFKARLLLFPTGSRREHLVRGLIHALRVLKNEGFLSFLRSIARFTRVLLSGEINPPPTSENIQIEHKLATAITTGVISPAPSISLVKIPESRQHDLEEKTLIDWVDEQTCPFVEIVVWDRAAKTAYRLDEPDLSWPAAEVNSLSKGLRGRYLCIADEDLLQHSKSYLEQNLLSLETESLAFTVNFKGQASWARDLLEKGGLPGNGSRPLLRQIVNKACVNEDFSIDLSEWIKEQDSFPVSVGKIITHTTNQHDVINSLPFEARIPAGEWRLVNERLVLRPNSEVPWEVAIQALHPIESVLPQVCDPSELPTVILALEFLAVGGAERLALNLIRNLKDRIRFVVVAVESLNPALGTTSDDFRAQTPYTYIIPEFLDPMLNLSFMRYLIERFQPVTLYIANGANWIYNALPEIKQSYPDLKTVNQVYDHQVGWINRYDLATVLSLDAHIGANEKICQAYLELGVRPEKVHFIEHGIDPVEVNPADYSETRVKVLKNLLGLPQDKRVATFTARLHPQKRPMDFIELARRFSDDDSVVFLMVGDGPLAQEVDRRITALGLNNLIRRKFYRPISDIYAVSDVMVLPSEYEAMPLVIAETQAMGKPVVATDVGNNREVLEMTGGGYIASRVGDLAALMEGVRKALETPPEAGRVRKAILSRFGIDIISKQYLDVLLGDQHA